jgi:nucleotide-binding universal stress UspA family protein
MTGATVVGYDGSATARAAVGFAAERRGTDGRVIVAHVAAVPAYFLETPYYERALDHARELGEATMREAEDLLGGAASELRVIEGPPARSLVELARMVDADEIAVGSRGLGAVRAAALGSTSHALLHETDRPTIVVTLRAAERQIRRVPRAAVDGGPLAIVGWDGSDAARAALEYAADQARRTNGRVVAVYAYDAPADFIGAPYFGRALAESQARGRELLAQLEGETGLGVEIETDLAEGPPVDAITRAAAARAAREIVVGSRGLGRFRAALGSVSHALLHEADCPVVVVPGPPRS